MTPADSPRGEAKPPVPDPTVLTTDALRREIKASTDLTNAKLEALAYRLDTKIDGNDRLSAERHEFTRRELANIEQRRLEHKEDTRSTVDTAFAGAEKAIAKSERAAADQIKSVEGSVDDLKDRVLRLETQQQTKVETRGDTRSNVGMIVGVLGAIFGFIMLAAVVIKGLGQ